MQQGTESPKIPHVLWRDTPGAAVCGSPGSVPNTASSTSRGEPVGSVAGATELVPANSRLTVFEISSSLSGLHTVNVGVAYGDTDLLTGNTGPNVRCKSGAGSQFCSAALLSTVVGRRL